MENSKSSSSPSCIPARWVSAFPGLLFVAAGFAAPVAVDDRYDTTEDLVLNTKSGPIISVDFDTNPGGFIPVFDGEWDYLDKLENQVGADHSYPLDGAGRDWNRVDFEIASSSIGPWLSGSQGDTRIFCEPPKPTFTLAWANIVLVS